MIHCAAGPEIDSHEAHVFIMRQASYRQHPVLYRVLVFTMCATYGLFFFLSSLCLATSLFHPHGPSDTHHHGHETEHTSTFLDICNLTLLALNTTDLETSVLPAAVLVCDKTDFEVAPTPTSILLLSQPAIRAPPFISS